MSKAIIVKSGDRYGRLSVLCEIGPINPKRRRFRCSCDCSEGTIKDVDLTQLRKGKVASCGCLQIDAHTTHGLSRSPTSESWRQMRHRCSNPNHHAYRYYGGRGIKVCERWVLFENFLADMGPRPSLKHSIDRFPDKNGNYEPGNCRWALSNQQNRNKRDNVWVKYRGEQRMMTEVCDELGLNWSTVYSRRRKGTPDERLFDPVK